MSAPGAAAVASAARSNTIERRAVHSRLRAREMAYDSTSRRVTKSAPSSVNASSPASRSATRAKGARGMPHTGWEVQEVRVTSRRSHHRIAALPQVNPEPNAVSTRRSPRASRPSASASSRAMGIDAAVVLPYFWMLA